MRVQRLKGTPETYKPESHDAIEATADPHTGPVAKDDGEFDEEAEPLHRRVRITVGDLKKY